MTQTIKNKNRNQKAITLIEIMVVVMVFTLMGVLITNIIFLTLRGTSKSSSVSKVRDNINYSLSIIERQLRNATTITVCPNDDLTRLDYIDSEGELSYFQCNVQNGLGYISSGSARLNSEELNISECSFECVEGESGNPPSVMIDISAGDVTRSNSEKGIVTIDSRVYLRNK